MRKVNLILILLIAMGMIAISSCNRNYYSSKGGGGCSCPNKRGMVGY